MYIHVLDQYCMISESLVAENQMKLLNEEVLSTREPCTCEPCTCEYVISHIIKFLLSQSRQ